MKKRIIASVLALSVALTMNAFSYVKAEINNDIVISSCDSVNGWFGQLVNGTDRGIDAFDKTEGAGAVVYIADVEWGVTMKYISVTPVDISTKSYIEFDLYVEDGKSIFNEATLAGIDLTSGGNPDVEAVSYNANFIKSLSLNNGWTHVVLKLSDAVARTETGTFKANEFDTFRFYLAGTTVGKQYVTKIDNLRATNGSKTTAVSTDSKKVLDNCDSIIGWETLGTIPTVDRVTKTEGTGSYNIRTRGNSFNMVYRPSLAVNGQKMESLSFDLYTSDANIFKDSTTSGIEITSSGASDNSELEWLKGVLASLTIIPGQWNTITLSASSASPTGVIDLSNINYFRLYVVNSTAKIIDVKIDNLNINVSNDIAISNCDSVNGWFGQLGNGDDRTVDTTDKAEGTGSIKYIADIGWGVAMKYISATPVDISTKSYIEFDLYVEDGKSIFNEATLAGIDLTSGGNPDVEAISYNANFVKSLSLNNGWTHVVLKLSDAVARTETGTFKANEFDTFRFYLFGTTAGKQYVTKIDNLRATNGSRTTAVSTDSKKVLDNCDSIVGWETLGTIPTVDRVTKTEGTGSYNIRTRGNAFNMVYRPSLAVNGQKMDSLSFDLYTSDANIFKDSTTTGIEITSSGASDNSELEWLKGVLASLTIIPDQWNSITLSASSASPTGVIDLSNINYFRLYVVNSTAKIIDVKIDNLNLNLDIVAPVVTGVIEGDSTGKITVEFNEGTATLNGNSFASGTEIKKTGSYSLIVTDPSNNVTSIHFKVIIYGDVSGDGQIDIIDLSLVKKHLLKISVLQETYHTAGEINRKGYISISDLIAVKKHLLNISPITKIKLSDSKEYKQLINTLSVAPPAAPVVGYGISQDNGLIYNPLSKEAEKTNQLNKYLNAPKTTGSVNVNGIDLNYSMPTKVSPYDLIPIEYSYTATEQTVFPIHFEATAFEEESKRMGRDLYDMSLPGKLDLSFEYLGYVTGTLKANARPIMKMDNTDTPTDAYPNYTTTEITKSGTVKSGDIQWFKFKYTNTGNTIIDPEGSGAMLFAPELHKKNDKGVYELFSAPYNLLYRIDDYMYPGETADIWFNFGPSARKPDAPWGLSSGDYRIVLKAVYRNEQSNPEDYAAKMWSGLQMATSNFDFAVSDTPTITTPSDIVSKYKINNSNKNTWLSKYEEFMTSFDTVKSSGLRQGNGIIYLQVAPWTKQAVIKIINANGIKTIAIPINVDNSSVKIKFNSENNNYAIVDGKKQPMFSTQIMADMRSNIQLSPYPQKSIVSEIKSMKNHGVNNFATTGMPWIFDQGGERVFAGYSERFNPMGDAYKYAIDIIRQLNSTIEGVMTYPINRGVYADIATSIAGKSFFGIYANGDRIPTTSKLLPEINSVIANYYFNRFGDIYAQNGKGQVPITIEDTRGWMRVDNNARYEDGPAAAALFATWLEEKYGSLLGINNALGTSFTKLSEINPELFGSSNNGHGLVYSDPSKPFFDWNLAMTNFDLFRTHIRLQNYKDIVAMLDTKIPNPKIAIRTEGANWLVSGIPSNTNNPHYRHIYYSQRRGGMIAEIIQSSDVVVSHSDYITLPYAPSEVRELTKMSVSQGIIPKPLPQFNNMRDMAVNPLFGTTIKGDYNLDTEQKAAYIHTLTASFPWYKAIYEEGGVPGILWNDYESDGVVNATQRKEMEFFQEKMAEALQTSAGINWSNNLEIPNQDWRNLTLKKNFYDINFVNDMIAAN